MFSRSSLILAAAVILAAIGIAAALKLPRSAVRPPAPDPTSVAGPDIRSALESASGWINGDRGALDSLSGNVVVLAMWSDTDPRCLEALPRVEGWHQAYSRYGVRVLGIYTPDFSFGVDSTVPLRITRRLGLGFPIALDPSYLVRSRLTGIVADKGIVLLAPDGHVITACDFDQPEEIDRAIREELRRQHPDLDFPADPVASSSAPSHEVRFVYLGAGRVADGPLASAVSGRTETFTTQFRFQEEGRDYVPIPVGRWTPTAEGLVAARGGASDFVAIRNPGKRLDAVLSPRDQGRTRVWILADDGWLPAAERGEDVRVDPRGASYVDVTEPRLYRIARAGREHVLRFSPEQPGLTVHAFSFEE